jgi:hypothetical protein
LCLVIDLGDDYVAVEHPGRQGDAVHGTSRGGDPIQGSSRGGAGGQWNDDGGNNNGGEDYTVFYRHLSC